MKTNPDKHLQKPNSVIAERATSLLIDLIRKNRDVESEGFYPQLIVRDSTCPAPKKIIKADPVVGLMSYLKNDQINAANLNN